MAELKAVSKNKVYEVKVRESVFTDKQGNIHPILSIGGDFKPLTIGKQKAKNIVANFDAIKEFAERDN